MNKSFFLLILIVFCFIIPKVTFAITLSPVRYELKGDPGETLTKEMTIINEGNFSATYYSSFANFEASGETGSATFVEPEEGIGIWMSTVSSIHFSAGDQKTISFTIKIPEDAEPGGHYGVIFWGTSPEKKEGEQVSVSSKTGALILLSVNGEVKEGGGLLSFKTKDDKFWYNSLPISFIYRFRNDGNDRIKPDGFVKIRNSVFIRRDKLDANPVNGNILPKSTRKFQIDWIKNPRNEDYVRPDSFIAQFFDDVFYQWKNFALGLYSAKLDINYGFEYKNNVIDILYFFVFPWQLVIFLIVIFTIIFFIGRKLLRKYNAYIIKKAQVISKLS